MSLTDWNNIWSQAADTQPLYDPSIYAAGKKHIDAFLKAAGDEGRRLLDESLEKGLSVHDISAAMDKLLADQKQRAEDERLQQLLDAKQELTAKRVVYEEAISHFAIGVGHDVIAPVRATFGKSRLKI